MTLATAWLGRAMQGVEQAIQDAFFAGVLVLASSHPAIATDVSATGAASASEHKGPNLPSNRIANIAITAPRNSLANG